MSVTETANWVDRFQHVMPWGSGTCSKKPALLPEEPQVIVRGKGCRVWDDQGREFIDFRNSLGPVTLGYGFLAVDDAIRRQLESGIIFGHPHPVECEVAEMLCEVIPCAEQARFLKTGGEAMAATIRIARAYTGRDHVIQIGYNGWVNSLARNALALPGARSEDYPPGVPPALGDLHHTAGWEDRPRLEGLFDQYHGKIAAVTVACSYPDMPRGREFLPYLRQLTQKHGTLLIFDEIVTGFRIAIGGAQEYFNVKPDLAVFAKGIANGMPLSVYLGSREVMSVADRFPLVSSTYAGETLSLAAAKAAITTYREQNVIGHLWSTGEKLWSQVDGLLAKYNLPVKMQGLAPCPLWQVSANEQWPVGAKLQEKLFRCAYRHGVSLYNVSYVNFSHQDRDVAETLTRLDAAFAEIKSP